MAKVVDTTKERELCEGLMLGESIYDKKENRMLTLFLKGFIVYLLTMGSIGFYLSAFKIEYNVIFVHIAILTVAIICALLYYRLLFENLGYLVLFAIFGILVYIFKIYINSGFYAIVNITVKEASEYLDVDMKKLYNEQISNRYITVTFAALFIGIVMDILLNVYISRRMKYQTAIFITMFFNIIPLYLLCEPDIIYVIMLIAGYAMAYVLKSGKHYSEQVKVKRDNNVFSFKGRKKEISYVYDVKALLSASFYALVLALILPALVSTIKPKESFNVGYTQNKYKEKTMDAFTIVLLEGIQGLFREGYDSTGGLNSGELGNVSQIKLDNMTDLILEYTPYSYGNVYLKSFVGVEYNPYDNYWSGAQSVEEYDNVVQGKVEADAYKEAYDAGEVNTAKGKMRIRPVDVYSALIPYYTYHSQGDGKGYEEIEYYPSISGNNVRIDEQDYKQAYEKSDLFVPEQNVSAIEEFIAKLGFVGTDEEFIEQVKAYFADNYPYTIKPGRTPKKKDFVNYFLTDNEKGYCAHYASAATLIFRYMGIPARYVEGYCVDYYEMTLNAEIVEDKSYSEYYDGTNELGKTAVVSLDVTDADAHAWVEVYIEGKGWIVVDVTPASLNEDENEDFWTSFNDRDDSASDDDDDMRIFEGGNVAISDETVKNVILTLAMILVVVVLLFVLIRVFRLIKMYIVFCNSTINDKLIIKYSQFRKRYGKKDKKFLEMYNYNTQVSYIDKTKEAKKIIAILEKAGFSNTTISENEYKTVIEWFRR